MFQSVNKTRSVQELLHFGLCPGFRSNRIAKGGHQSDPALIHEILSGKQRLHDVERVRTDVSLVHLQDDITQIGQGMIRDRTQEHLGRSENSVHGLHHRGRRALQRALTQAGATPCTLAA